MLITHDNAGRIYDIITGERVYQGDSILATGILTRSFNPNHAMRSQPELYIKEDTLVWLAEKAGYTLTKRDAGDSGDTKVVDGTDASVRGGEAEAGEAEVGGSEKPARRSRGTTKGK